DFKDSVLSNVAAIISTNGSWGVTSDGVLVAQRIEAKEVVADKFSVKAAFDAAERAVGVGRIQAGYDATLIMNPLVTSDSVIIVTFETNPGANWWIEEKQQGQFMLKMAQGAHVDQKFTYWIVPITGTLDTAVTDSGTGTPETAPPTESGSGTPETGGGETGSGSGTTETP
ncbi:MAG: hypothetical protein AAB554_05175, partial [Patescibacteria group bacterium]